MKSAISIDVAAPAEVVFALARDVERWPRLLAHYEDVRILERRPDGSVVARMIARRPVFGLLGIGLPVAWRSRTWSEPETCRIRFVHQRRRDERDGRHVADRDDRGGVPGHDRARLPAAVRAVGTVHRPVLHPPDRRTDARHIQGDRGGVWRAQEPRPRRRQWRAQEPRPRRRRSRAAARVRRRARAPRARRRRARTPRARRRRRDQHEHAASGCS